MVYLDAEGHSGKYSNKSGKIMAFCNHSDASSIFKLSDFLFMLLTKTIDSIGFHDECWISSKKANLDN